MTNPKLALIPSGYKGGTNPTVYSILPSDGGGDFTFDRASEGTRVRKDGLIEEVSNDVPRLDWSDGNCPSLLLEPQRTNLLKYSEDYSQSEWSKIRSTISTNQSIAPNGTFTADKIIASTDNNTHRCDQAITLTDGTTYSLSFFVKSSEYNCIRASIGQSGLTFGNVASFNLNTKTVSTIGTIENAEILDFGNGWFRCVLTMDAGTIDRIVIGLGIDDSYSFAGDNSSGLFMWGAMIEEASYTSSYIKTTTGQVTRLFDDLESDTSYSTENDVTWFLDFDTYTFENSFRAAMVVRNSGFTQTMDWISYNSGSDYYIRIRATNQSALQTIIDLGEDAIQMFTRNKVAVRLYGSNFEIYVNGTREYIGISDDGDWTLLNNSAILNDFGTTSERPSTKLYDFRVYDQTMTQSELEELTQV